MDIDLNTLRTLVTVTAMATFLGIVWWAYGPSRKGRFEQDGLLPFDAEQRDAELRAGLPGDGK